MRGWVNDQIARGKAVVPVVSKGRETTMNWRERSPKARQAANGTKIGSHLKIQTPLMPLALLRNNNPSAPLSSGVIITPKPRSNEHSLMPTSSVQQVSESWDSMITLDLPELPKDWLTSTLHDTEQILASNPAGFGSSATSCTIFERESLLEEVELFKTDATPVSEASASVPKYLEEEISTTLLTSVTSNHFLRSNSSEKKTTFRPADLRMIDRGVQTHDWLGVRSEKNQRELEKGGKYGTYSENEERAEKGGKLLDWQKHETGGNELGEESGASRSVEPSGFPNRNQPHQDDTSAEDQLKSFVSLSEPEEKAYPLSKNQTSTDSRNFLPPPKRRRATNPQEMLTQLSVAKHYGCARRSSIG
ncbi:hypothetical protein P7C70_g8918, partial [Phenoliferia sp. Uapishka_3]